MKVFIIFLAYQILSLCAIPFFLIYILLRKFRKKSVFGSLKDRLGFCIKSNKNKRIVWIHAVSVGEILSVQYMINTIKARYTNVECYITTGTLAGKNIAKQALCADHVSFLPYDFLLPMIIAFHRIKPNVLIAVEAELWPNLFLIAHYKSIPAYLINARINPKSKSKIHFFKSFFSPILNTLNQILAQSQADLEAFKKLDVKSSKISLLGNIKAFNVLEKKRKFPHFSFQEKIEKIRNQYFVLLAGSIHPGELSIYLDLFCSMKNKYANLKLIIAPRHFDWKNKLIKEVEKTGFTFLVCSDNTKDKAIHSEIDIILENYDIILICKIGELFSLYLFSSMFFLGGTFVSVGGHNLLEPAVWGTPIIIGPYYHNCYDHVKKLESANAIIKVENKLNLRNQTELLIENKDTRTSMQKNSTQWLKHEAKLVENNLNKLYKDLKQFL
jgi:3-deoxy-D-manno-octulosonic-acid transferase